MACTGSESGAAGPGGNGMDEKSSMTYIRKGLQLQGDLVADEDVTIGGEFTGNIAASGSVTVLRGGRVKGNVTAANVVVEGSLEGSVTVAEKFELRRRGRMLGDVKASVVIIAEKTFLRGKVLATERMSTQIKSLRRRVRAANAAGGARSLRGGARTG